MGGDFGLAQDQPDLGSVAVTDGHVPAGFDHVGDVESGFVGGLVLVLNALVGVIFNQGISTDSDYCDLLF